MSAVMVHAKGVYCPLVGYGCSYRLVNVWRKTVGKEPHNFLTIAMVTHTLLTISGESPVKNCSIRTNHKVNRDTGLRLFLD